MVIIAREYGREDFIFVDTWEHFMGNFLLGMGYIYVSSRGAYTCWHEEESVY